MFLNENELLSLLQSGLTPGKAALANSLVSIAHEMSFNERLEVNDISKAQNVQQKDINLKYVSSDLKNKIQKVISNERSFSWSSGTKYTRPSEIHFEFSSFLIHNNDLGDGLSSNPKLFTDDKVDIFGNLQH